MLALLVATEHAQAAPAWDYYHYHVLENPWVEEGASGWQTGSTGAHSTLGPASALQFAPQDGPRTVSGYYSSWTIGPIDSPDESTWFRAGGMLQGGGQTASFGAQGYLEQVVDLSDLAGAIALGDTKLSYGGDFFGLIAVDAAYASGTTWGEAGFGFAVELRDAQGNTILTSSIDRLSDGLPPWYETRVAGYLRTILVPASARSLVFRASAEVWFMGQGPTAGMYELGFDNLVVDVVVKVPHGAFPPMSGGVAGGDPPLSPAVPEPAGAALGVAGALGALAARSSGTRRAHGALPG